MPIERDLGKILAKSDNDLIQWRENAREFLSSNTDEQLKAVYQASIQEIVVRAERAWAAAARHNGPR